jgi:hypothetical protein
MADTACWVHATAYRTAICRRCASHQCMHIRSLPAAGAWRSSGVGTCRPGALGTTQCRICIRNTSLSVDETEFCRKWGSAAVHLMLATEACHGADYNRLQVEHRNLLCNIRLVSDALLARYRAIQEVDLRGVQSVLYVSCMRYEKHCTELATWWRLQHSRRQSECGMHQSVGACEQTACAALDAPRTPPGCMLWHRRRRQLPAVLPFCLCTCRQIRMQARQLAEGIFAALCAGE